MTDVTEFSENLTEVMEITGNKPRCEKLHTANFTPVPMPVISDYYYYMLKYDVGDWHNLGVVVVLRQVEETTRNFTVSEA